MNRGAITLGTISSIAVTGLIVIAVLSYAHGHEHRLVLVPYTGVGIGVLQNGTVLDLHGRDQYQSPDDIIGKIDKPGLWKVQ